MKVCAESAANSEYTLCGDSFDSYLDGLGEQFSFANEVNKPVNCGGCKRVIADIYKVYTKTGRLRSAGKGGE